MASVRRTVTIVLVNDGTGHYPVRIEFAARGIQRRLHARLRRGGLRRRRGGLGDLLLTHTRNSPDGGWRGRYVHVLANPGGSSFADETATRRGDQSATPPERRADGGENLNLAEAEMHDGDRDGCADLVMSRGRTPGASRRR